MIGRVVSNKTLKTVSVIVESRKSHPLYKKTYAWSKKYLAHDELGAQMGDIVRIIKSRPYSKRKHWLVTKILGRDIVPMSEEALKAEAEEVIAEVMPEVKEEVEASVEVKAETEKTEQKKEVKETKAKEAKTKKPAAAKKGGKK